MGEGAKKGKAKKEKKLKIFVLYTRNKSDIGITVSEEKEQYSHTLLFIHRILYVIKMHWCCCVLDCMSHSTWGKYFNLFLFFFTLLLFILDMKRIVALWCPNQFLFFLSFSSSSSSTSSASVFWLLAISHWS